MTHDALNPRSALLAVLASAFARGIPEIEGRVDVLRVDPVWGDDELPLILIDFDSERLEAQSVSPRKMLHTLSIDILVYCKGEAAANRLLLMRLIDKVSAIMREWQFIAASDIAPDWPDPDFRVIEEIRPGDSINYFRDPGGDQDHRAARLAYEADFMTFDSSTGEEMVATPPRNVLAEFDKVLAQWREKHPPHLTAEDEYSVREGD